MQDMLEQAPKLWEPHDAQAQFLANPSYEVLYGGAAGGGKSDALLMGGLRYIHIKGYQALIVRRTFPELKELIDRSHEVFPAVGGTWSGDEKRWKFPSGAVYEFGYLERYEDIMRYQGRQFAYIAWDELGQCPEERMWTKLMAWNRTPVKGIRKMMRASANPGGPGHAWLKKRFISVCEPDGTPFVDPNTGFSRAFVASTVHDNPTIMQNDPQYVRQLELLPETLRRQLLHGDWSAGTGLALEELEERVHMCEPFDIPGHWVQFGSFDWGFRHPWVFGWYAADEDGNVYKVDTVTGRRDLPRVIAQKIKSRVPVDRLDYLVAGHDIFQKHTARGGNDPSLEEVFAEEGFVFRKANIDRVRGLNNLREYTAWQEREDGPRFKLFDTPGNRYTFEILEGMVIDEKNPEDALKVDADPDTGQGGDDAYDETRYALASRPARADTVDNRKVSAWDSEVLAAEAEKQRYASSHDDDVTEDDLVHDEFGLYF